MNAHLVNTAGKKLNRLEMTADFETITPEKAKTMLDASTGPHRRDSKKSVIRFTDDMQQERWMENGESIKIDWDGNVCDGRRVLQAIVQSNTTQRMLVVRNVDPAAYVTIGIGSTRGSGDMLTYKGSNYGIAAASATRLIIWYERLVAGDDNVRKSDIKLHEVLDYWGKNPKIEDYTLFNLNRCSARKVLTPATTVALAIFALRAGHPEEVVQTFLHRVGDGVNLNAKSPVLRLRSKVERIRAAGQPRPIELLALTIEAFNAYVQSQEIRQLRGIIQGVHPTVVPFDAKRCLSAKDVRA